MSCINFVVFDQIEIRFHVGDQVVMSIFVLLASSLM